jgi:hypothetical protein
MKRLTILSCAVTMAAGMLLSVHATAEEQDNTRVTISAPAKDRIQLPDQYRSMSRDEFRDYYRTYTLSNGMSLSVFNWGGATFAAMDDKKWHMLVAANGHTFVALDRQLKMTINLQGEDSATGELYFMQPAQQASSSGTNEAQLVHVVMR